MLGGRHFEAHAGVYGWARPDYPPALWERLRGLGVLRPGLRVVELGAGSGQATARLVDAGLDVTAVEPGAQLAATLRRRCPGAVVLETTAEEAELGEDGFDVAVAATSVHWLDLPVVLPKLRRALVDHGWFLVWRNSFGDPEAAVTPFRRHVRDIVAERRGPRRSGPADVDTAGWAGLLTASGLFTLELVEHFRWSIELDEDQVRGLFTTFSDWSAAEVDAAGRAVRRLGGRVVEHYVTPLIALRAVGDEQQPSDGDD